MNTPLSDPNLPAGAIIKEYEDGGALRNDGEELRPANENPWYVLATIYGEQERGGVNVTLHSQNRGIWNRWMCKGMQQNERLALALKLGVPKRELYNFSDEDQTAMDKAFSERAVDKGRFEHSNLRSYYINFSKFYFSNGSIFESF